MNREVLLQELIESLENLVRVGKTVGTVGQGDLGFGRKWSKAYERAEKAVSRAKGEDR